MKEILDTTEEDKAITRALLASSKDEVADQSEINDLIKSLEKD